MRGARIWRQNGAKRPGTRFFAKFCKIYDEDFCCAAETNFYCWDDSIAVNLGVPAAEDLRPPSEGSLFSLFGALILQIL